ncbi:MAG: hypothetical protein AB1726_05810 [Planctomycetota bacterium]
MSSRRSPFLTPAKASLVMVALGTIALMGVPGVGAYLPPAGTLAGIVLDRRGEAVEDIPVALFDAASLSLLEVAHTDAHGRFAFQQASSRFHLFAHPAPASGRVGAWRLSLSREEGREVEISLPSAHPVHVAVTDEMGMPIEGAEVRAYDARATGEESTVVVRVLTDEEGEALLPAPPAAHIGVVGHDGHHLSGWRFDQEIPPGGADFAFSLPRGTLFHGRVVGPGDQPLSGILVSAWDERAEGWQWNGYQLTDPDGRFDLFGAEESTVLRAVDLTQSYLPLALAAENGPRMSVELARGAPLRIHCTDGEEGDLPSRVWVWSPEGQAWSWGTRTDDKGTLQASVSSRHAVVARPLRGDAAAPVAAWDRFYDAPDLELSPAAGGGD